MSSAKAAGRGVAAGILSVLLWPASLWAADPLVSTDWVKGVVGRPGIAIVDLRLEPDYARNHIPGAVNLPTGQRGWQLGIQGSPGGTPPETNFVNRVSALGIGNADHVVVVHAGKTVFDVAAATQVYWTFRYMGHAEISIMNGGMLEYSRRQPIPLDSAPVIRQPVAYRVQLRPELLATTKDIRDAVAGQATLVDNRDPPQYLGINKDILIPRYGTLPKAHNNPVAWLTIDGGGLIRSPNHLRAMYAYLGIPLEGPRIAFSNFGVLASLGWFISHELLASKNTRLYMPGLTEWMSDDGNPLDRRLNFDQ
ncbi:MAG: sulfurtransferase [Alphaproteobacteria bacterium]